MLDMGSVLAETKSGDRFSQMWPKTSSAAGASGGVDSLLSESNKGLPTMKFRAIAAAAAVFAMAMPTASTAADDDVSYPRLTHCAAFTMLMGQVMGYGDDKDKPENKAAAATYKEQSMALTVIAVVVSKKDAKEVAADVNTQNDAMIKSLSEKGAVDRMLEQDLKPCTDLGKAAVEVVKEASKK
jgi:hypothetical protein